jgi:hypothetical protein
LFVHHDAWTGIGARASRVIEQGRKSLFHADLQIGIKPAPCPIINSC